MSTSIISTLAFIGKQVTIYGGILMLVGGAIGGLLNIIVFLSLRTFRESSCAFYLTILSIVNIGQLFTALLPRLMLTIYGSDGTENSLFYCKFRLFLSTTCTLISMSCFCLATIDQYCATSAHRQLRRFNNLKLARYVVIIFIIIWILHTIPYLVLFEHVISSTTGKVSCIMTNTIYIQYRAYGIVLSFLGFLPVSITLIFGLMAYHNVKNMAHYTVPLVQRELDKQLTIMVLVQVFLNVFTLLPYSILYAVQLNVNSDPFVQAQIQFAFNIAVIVYFIYFANPFYVYICVSERFRRQLVYVLFKIYFNKCRQQQPTIVNNQVAPQS